MYQPKMDAYEGSENYIFISYAHRDAEKVWPILDALNDRGYRVWYDDGIDAGSEWPAYIEDHLNRCAAVVSFISPNAVASANCRREITYALSQNKPFVYVMLEETELAQGMSLQLSGQYCINRGALSEEKFLKKLCGSDALTPCRSEDAANSMPNVADVPQQPPVKPRFGKTHLILFVLMGVALIAAAFFLMPKTDSTPPSAATEAPTAAPVISEEEQRYLDAKALYDAGDYHAAYVAFSALGGYRDTDSWLLSDPHMTEAAAAYHSYRSRFKPSAVVQLGRYEQDNDFSDGPEPIDWLVLRTEGDAAFLVSAKILDSKAYQNADLVLLEDAAAEKIPEGEDRDAFMRSEAFNTLVQETRRELMARTTWENCSLRAWLNNDFLNAAFTAKERRSILPTMLTPDTVGPEQVTEDMIFLLYRDAIRRGFDDLNKGCQASEYAKQSLTVCGPGDWTYFYWCYGPSGLGQRYANVGIDNGGFLFEGIADRSSELEVDDAGIGVRPCLVLDISLANSLW